MWRVQIAIKTWRVKSAATFSPSSKELFFETHFLFVCFFFLALFQPWCQQTPQLLLLYYTCIHSLQLRLFPCTCCVKSVFILSRSRRRYCPYIPYKSPGGLYSNTRLRLRLHLHLQLPRPPVKRSLPHYRFHGIRLFIAHRDTRGLYSRRRRREIKAGGERC